MIPRTPVCVAAVCLALSAVTACEAAPDASAPTEKTSFVSFDIQDHDQHVTLQDGTVMQMTLNKDGSSMMDLNGTQTRIDRITRDGKSYFSFLWNGHKVFVADGCRFHIDSDGLAK